jgi:hypothetical protein
MFGAAFAGQAGAGSIGDGGKRLDEIQRVLDRQLASANPQTLAARLLREAVQRRRGVA